MAGIPKDYSGEHPCPGFIGTVVSFKVLGKQVRAYVMGWDRNAKKYELVIPPQNGLNPLSVRLPANIVMESLK